MYTITVRSPFEELWRYNLMMMCAGYDADHTRLYVQSEEMIYNEDLNISIAKLPPAPADFVANRPLVLVCDEAHSIQFILYVVTHTLPMERRVESSPPFPILISVVRDAELIYEQLHEVNQWGGTTIDLEL